MRSSLPRSDIQIILGDLTKQPVDAIVNAANSTLLGGGGVDGAIHNAAGPKLLDACRNLGGCQAGEARITPGFDLPARWVVHTVGPIWRGGTCNEREVLARCYRSSLALAATPEYAIRTIAFPSISTGAFGFPIDEAATTAIDEADRFQSSRVPFRKIVFVCFSDAVLNAYIWAARAVLE